MSESLVKTLCRIIILGLFLACCGRLSRPYQSKIVGGRDLAAEPTLQAVTLALLDAHAKPFCSGTLLSRDWIVTAAHCVQDRQASELTVARWSDGALAEKSQVIGIVPYAAQLKGLEFPNFDVALLRFAGFPGDTPPIPSIASPALAIEGHSVILAGFGAERSDCEADDCHGHGRFIQSRVVERLHSSRMRSLLRMQSEAGSGACRGDSGGPAFMRQGTGFQLLGATLGVWRDLMPDLDTQSTELCESGQVLYTDLRDYRPWIEAVIAGHEAPQTMTEPRPSAADFTAWCQYENSADEAWKTLQRLLQASAQEEGVDSKKLFLDCSYAMTVLKKRAQLEISFARPEGGAKLYPLKSLAPLPSLGPITLLSIYFNRIEKLEVPEGLLVQRLEIVSSSLDGASLCHLAANARLQELSLWGVSGDSLDLGCLLQSPSLKKLEIGGMPLPDPGVLERLRRQMSVIYEDEAAS